MGSHISTTGKGGPEEEHHYVLLEPPNADDIAILKKKTLNTYSAMDETLLPSLPDDISLQFISTALLEDVWAFPQVSKVWMYEFLVAKCTRLRFNCFNIYNV